MSDSLLRSPEDDDGQHRHEDEEEEEEDTDEEEEMEEDEEEHEDEDDRRASAGRYHFRSANALQNILSVLVGRGGEIVLDSDSDSDDSLWPTLRPPRQVTHVKPNKQMIQVLRQSDFNLLTLMRLQANIPTSATLPPSESAETPSSASTSASTSTSTSKASSSNSEKPKESVFCRFFSASKSKKCKRLKIKKEEKANTQVNEMSNVLPKDTKIPALLARRELGDFRHSRGFSVGRRCQIYSSYLPNHGTQVAKFAQKIFCGSYSNCGNLFMSACQDQNIRIIDTSSGNFNLLRTIRARNVGWSVLDTALSPDNRHLIYSSWCDYIHQVNISGEEENHTALPLSPEDGRFCLFSLRFSEDGDQILGGANDGYIYLFDRLAQTETLKINAHDDDVNAVAFADVTTHILASGGDDGVCKIWDRRALRESRPVPVGVFAGHVDGITYIDPRGDGRHLITNSKDQSIKLWDLRKFSGCEAVNEARRAVRNQNWDYRWQSVPKHLAKPRNNVVTSDTSVMTYRGHTVLQTLIRCKFSPVHTTGQRYIYTGCASGAVVIYDALTGEIVQVNRGHHLCVRDVSWHPYMPELISSSWDHTMTKWEFRADSVSAEIASSNESKSDLVQENKRSCSLLKVSQSGQPFGDPDEDLV